MIQRTPSTRRWRWGGWSPRTSARPRPALGIGVPGLLPGRYRVSLFDTVGSAVIRSLDARCEDRQDLTVPVDVATDLAIAFTRK